MNLVLGPLLLLVLGLLLVFAEILIPSGGLIGVTALGVLGLGLWQAFGYSNELGVTVLLTEVVALPATAAGGFAAWSRTRQAGRVMLSPPTPDELDVSHSQRDLHLLIGRIGRAATPLYPSGHVLIEGDRLDGLSEDCLIPAGARVEVVRVRSGRVIVRRLPDGTGGVDAPPEDASRVSDLSPAVDLSGTSADHRVVMRRDFDPSVGPSTAEAVANLEETP